MKALVREGGRTRFDERRADPAPGEGEALVRVRRAALDLVDALVGGGRGPDPDFEGVLGRQFVGVVESVADGGDESLVGARICGNADIVCGACDLCRAGLRAHCRNRRTIGVSGRDGACAELLCLPTTNLVSLPDALDDDAALLAPSLAAALQAVQQLHIQGKPYITVLGDTVVALLTAQLMSRLNASVRVLGDSEQRLARCEQWGVQHRLASEVGRRADQDAVVDCTGSSEGLRLATQLVRPRGKVLVKSFAASAARSGDADALRNAVATLLEGELEILGSRQGPLHDAVQALSMGEVEVEGLIRRREPPSRAAPALEQIAAGKDDLIAIDL